MRHIADVLDVIFGQLGSGSYSIDEAFDNVTITGFCPEQSARNRLQWVTLVIGAYVKSYFSDIIEILPVDDTPTMIPIEKTYWKPKLSYTDYITRVRAYAYTFTVGTPQTTDAWVTDGTTTWIVTKTAVSLANPNAPVAAPTHEVTVDNLYLINSDNIDEILTHLSTYYFKRSSVEAAIVNNGEYLPGERVQIYTDENSMAEGYIESADFAFGIQAKSTVHLTPVDVLDVGFLIVTHKYGSVILGEKRYTLPVDYEYTIVNKYYDETWAYTRYIFRPTSASVTGTISAGDNAKTVEYAKALESLGGVLTVYSVDNLSMDENGVVTIS